MTAYKNIRAAIMSFDFGFDEVEETKEDPDTVEWIDRLAEHIDHHLED